MNPKEAILKIRALFEDMPEPMPEEEKVDEVKVEMAEYVLEDGTKVMISSLEVGGEVVLEDGSPAPDGEHKLADGQVIVTEGSKIKEVKVEEEPAVEIEVEAGNKKMDEMEAKLSALEIENESLKAKLSEVERKAAQGFSQVIELIEEIAKVPQADPIEKTQGFKFESTKDIKFDRLAKYRNAILNNKN